MSPERAAESPREAAAAALRRSTASREPWLDLARGVAVVLMVLAHVVDAWTRDADRTRPAYHGAAFAAGLAAPAFLFLAGIGTAMAARARARRGLPPLAIARALVLRGAAIFGLAFVFRLQALVLGLGHPLDVLKVDILNVMGPALVAAAAVWGIGGRDGVRLVLAAALTVACAFATPPVFKAPWIEALPAPLQWYLRPSPGHGHFTLLPWAAFVLAGLSAGVAITWAAGRRQRVVQGALLALAVGVGAAAAWASFQPSIYPPGVSSYWDSSPAFFFVRLALVAALVPLAWFLTGVVPAPLRTMLTTLGAASLFVYWVHVELVYGGLAILIKHRVPLELTLPGTFAVAYGLSRLVPVAAAWVAAPAGRPEPVRRLVARLL